MPTVQNVRTRWSLERQVRFGAGLLVLTGAAFALTINAHWLFLCAFIDLGLTFAGLIDICPMAEIRGPMPWNAKPHCKTNLANADFPGEPGDFA